MGKNKLILKRPNSQVNPMEIYRKKMREKEKSKLKEKRLKHNNNNPESNKRPQNNDFSSNPLLENLYNGKKNKQIASINPDLISEDIDSFQNLFERKTNVPPEKQENFNQRREFQGDHNQRKNDQNKTKNREKRQSNDHLQKDPRFSDPFFQVTVQENYNPLKKQQKPVNVLNAVNPMEKGPESDIVFQRNPPTEDQVGRVFAPIIQKEPELKNKSKIDVSKEKTLFMPPALRMKLANPGQNLPDPKDLSYGSIRNISNVPAPIKTFESNVNNSNFQKLSSFLDEINKLNN